MARSGRLGRKMLKQAAFTTGMLFGLAVLGGSRAGAQAGTPKPVTGAQVPAAPTTPVQRLPKTTVQGFPPVDPKNFTAASPDVATVNSFLHALWGYDENRIWSVAAIEPTVAPGVVQVHVLVSDKVQPGRVALTTLFITPDGKHAIAGEVVSFGAQPFAETRAVLQQRADGPARGATGKQLELVEFTDLQCPTCKAAHNTVDELLQDFPDAHIVFEDMPLTAVHPFAFQAAAVGHCVRQAKGDAAFFTYVRKVYDTQAELTKDKAEATLRAAATEAGADAPAVMTCAGSPATQDAVNAVIKLGTDIGVTNVPTLVINGRPLPIAQVPSETLKRVIAFQGSLDGLTVRQQPSLKTLK